MKYVAVGLPPGGAVRPVNLEINCNLTGLSSSCALAITVLIVSFYDMTLSRTHARSEK